VTAPAKPSKIEHLLAKALKAHLRLDYPLALKRYAKLGRQYPADARVSYFGALCAYGAQDIPLAISLMEHSIQCDPKNAESHYNLGKFCLDVGRDSDALECFCNALELKPDFPEALNNIGNLYLGAGEYETAEACYQKSLALPSRSPDAKYNLSYLKLMRGQFREGWADYEARWQTPGYLLEYKRDFMTQHPRWVGAPLAGRRLFVMSEQGFGDTIQFSRYLPHLLEWVGPFTVEVQRQLVDLLRRNLDTRITVIGRGDPVPDMDLWCSMMSLPAAFSGMMPPTPSPYLRPANLVYLPRDGSTRNVGLCWAGSTGHKNDHNRSLPWSAMLPLATVPGINWYSLQIGPREAEAQGASWLHLAGDRWQTFDASASFVAGLDLVITCDSAVAHLAGALGVPCWVMIPAVPDFRWQLERTDSPWYPTLRLYRQAHHGGGGWGGVIERIVHDLQEG
jgi:hypothetical protein